jgi:hypothetical protein
MKTATWFGIWAVVGACGALALLAAPTIGIFVLPATLLLGGVLARRAPRWLAGPGILAGLGVPLLYVGYLNRGGPGTICTAWAGGGQCTQETSPWPWVGAGLVLALAGVTLALAAAHRRQRAQAGP